MAESHASLQNGAAVSGDWRTDRPGLRRLTKPLIPAPDMAKSVRNATE
jgi:hypothetical protein